MSPHIEPVGPSDDSGVEVAFTEILAEIVGVESVSPDSHFFDDLGADSSPRTSASATWTPSTRTAGCGTSTAMTCSLPTGCPQCRVRPDASHLPATMTSAGTALGRILPASVETEECFGEPIGGAILPGEESAVAGAVAVRRREYSTVRVCARVCLERLGYAPVAIPPGAGGAPVWPAGVRGSLTHCVGYAAAADFAAAYAVR